MSGLDAGLVLAAGLNPLAPEVGFSKTGGLVLRDLLLILGATLVLGTFLIFWAVNRSRRAKSSRRHHRRHAHSTNADATSRTQDTNEHKGNSSSAASVPDNREHHHRRRRRRRRDHRSRNPTLAQTGGLPPKRSQPLPPPVP